MKKYLATVILALFVMSACNKKEETPVDQRTKTEATISDVVNEGEKIENSKAAKALETMPENAPIASSFPVGTTGKSSVLNMITTRVPFFKKSVVKSPLDTLAGTWVYNDSTGEWNHTSTEPSDGILLIWQFEDSVSRVHTAKLEFKNLVWYNDTLLVRFNANLYVDEERVAYTNYELTVSNDVATRLVINGAIIGIAEFALDISAANGHNLEEEDFCGTVHISFNDLESGTSFTLDITTNEDGSGSFKFVINDGDDTWEFFVTVSAPEAITGIQRVSGYIKCGDRETARIEGTITGGDFSQIYIIYSDGTRVSISDHINEFGSIFDD